jgi:hypothetical protein
MHQGCDDEWLWRAEEHKNKVSHRPPIERICMPTTTLARAWKHCHVTTSFFNCFTALCLPSVRGAGEDTTYTTLLISSGKKMKWWWEDAREFSEKGHQTWPHGGGVNKGLQHRKRPPCQPNSGSGLRCCDLCSCLAAISAWPPPPPQDSPSAAIRDRRTTAVRRHVLQNRPCTSRFLAPAACTVSPD